MLAEIHQKSQGTINTYVFVNITLTVIQFREEKESYIRPPPSSFSILLYE